MIISTMNDLPGFEVTQVLGEVFGLTVRARHVGSQVGAGLKSLVGGELRGQTKMLIESRQQAQQMLFQRRANEELEGWMQEIRSEAFVDYRLDAR